MQTQTEHPATFSGYSEAERKALLQLAVDHENAQHKRPTIHIIHADDLTHFLATHQREERVQLLVEEEGIILHWIYYNKTIANRVLC